MADVFISYAREDREFVSRLTDACKARDRESWVDWERIEPSDQWWQSITEAIDAADTFVFVLSPDSIVSPVCLREVDHAAGENKRAIGVVCRSVEDLPVPPAVAAVNWIFMRESDDFDAGLAQLERALDLDLDLVRVHTRVLTRARAWELADRRPTPLLRGEELRAAERWMQRAAAGTEPQPTDLQAEFVAESRHRAARRQRLALAGSLGVTVLALGLATFAFVQRSQARHDARIARSRELAARAAGELATNPEGSIALAAQGVGVQQTPQAIHALSDALGASRLRAEWRQPSPVEALSFSPDGTTLATGADDGAVRLRRVSDGRLLWSEGKGGLGVTGMTFARQGDAIVVARGSLTGGAGCSVERLSAATGARTRLLESVASGSCRRFVGFLGSTRTVAVGEQSGAVRLWNADTGRQVGTVPGLGTPSGAFVGPGGGFTFTMGFRPDGRAIAAAGNDDRVRIVSVSRGRPLAKIEGQGLLKPDSLAFSPDGRKLLIASRNGAVVDDLSFGQVNETADQVEQTVVKGVAWSPDGRLYADAAGNVHAWATRTDRMVDELHGPSSQTFTAVAFSAHGLLAGGSYDGSVRIWAPDPDLPVRQIRYPSDVSPFSAGGAARVHLAAVGNASGAVIVTDDQGTQRAQLSPHANGAFGAFVVTANGELGLIRDGRLDLVGLRSGQTVNSISLPHPVSSFDVSADGRTAATLTADGVLTVLSGMTSHTAQVAVDQSLFPTVLISPDASLIAITAATHPPGITILRRVGLVVSRTEPGSGASFSPSGKLLAIQRPDLSIVVLGTDNWRTKTVMRGASAPRASISFSPDERLVAATSFGVLRTWDATDGTLLSTRHVIDDIAYSASNLALSAPVLTAAGIAVVGVPDTASVDGFDACASCLSVPALLAQAKSRLSEIRPVNSS